MQQAIYIFPKWIKKLTGITQGFRPIFVAALPVFHEISTFTVKPCATPQLSNIFWSLD